MENKKRLLKSNVDHGVVFTMMTEEVSALNISQQNYLKQLKRKGGGVGGGEDCRSRGVVSHGSKKMTA